MISVWLNNTSAFLVFILILHIVLIRTEPVKEIPDEVEPPPLYHDTTEHFDPLEKFLSESDMTLGDRK